MATFCIVALQRAIEVLLKITASYIITPVDIHASIRKKKFLAFEYWAKVDSVQRQNHNLYHLSIF